MKHRREFGRMEAIFAINERIDKAYLTEERHVFRQADSAIEELFDFVFSKFKANEKGEFKTKLYYEPYTRDCNIYEQGYPIYLKCIEDEANLYNTKMLVADRNDNPEEILLTVNFAPFRSMMKNIKDVPKMLPTEELIKRIMKSSLKHEFGHIRQNYSIHYGHQRLIDNRKFVSDNIDKSLVKNANPSMFEQVKKFMYLFSPIEQQQRCAELYEYVNNMTEAEIFQDLEDKRLNRGQVDDIIVETETIHLRDFMKESIETAEWWGKAAPNGFKLQALIAFYFRYYNLYKPHYDIPIDDIMSGKTELSEVESIGGDFIFYLKDKLLEYTKKIYNVVHYNLYKRFFEWSDIEHYGVDFGERISEGVVEELNTIYGDKRIPLLNKPVDY